MNGQITWELAVKNDNINELRDHYLKFCEEALRTFSKDTLMHWSNFDLFHDIAEGYKALRQSDLSEYLFNRLEDMSGKYERVLKEDPDRKQTYSIFMEARKRVIEKQENAK